MKYDKTTLLDTKVRPTNYLVAKTSKTMGGAIEKLDRASFLLYEIKTDLDETATILQEIKQGPIWNIKPTYTQKELFSFVVLPEENEALTQLCLGSLVETL